LRVNRASVAELRDHFHGLAVEVCGFLRGLAVLIQVDATAIGGLDDDPRCEQRQKKRHLRD
jgi:hypothetical protein